MTTFNIIDNEEFKAKYDVCTMHIHKMGIPPNSIPYNVIHSIERQQNNKMYVSKVVCDDEFVRSFQIFEFSCSYKMLDFPQKSHIKR